MKKRIKKVIFLTILAFGFLLGYYFLNYKYNFSIPCLFHKITNFYCPGCGITRMIFSLLKGHIYEAFRCNPFVFILFPFLIFYVIYNIYLYIFDKKESLINKVPKITWYILLILLIIYGIIRNIPYFSFLRP